MILNVNIFFLKFSVNKWSSQYFRLHSDGRNIVSALLALLLSKHDTKKPGAYLKHVHSVSKISSVHSKTLWRG